MMTDLADLVNWHKALCDRPSGVHGCSCQRVRDGIFKRRHDYRALLVSSRKICERISEWSDYECMTAALKDNGYGSDSVYDYGTRYDYLIGMLPAACC